ncbi:uncharacterized protein EAF02_004428 [Botrytis sinoallii]|uniref:uncharacterized protein n=1 Tax=Botrytis sinoallii TaxID=1463999 RepID=UPI001902A904|nr:uncharacterized protein EAF02_004428 [Botrytis sinoallii]KAF7885919.1 hypothetical protein EAF02_004428 [Botrytis sinoallii]
MSCCSLNACYLAVAVLSAAQCPLLKTVGSPSLDELASGVCALLGGSVAVANACNCLTTANAPGACGSGCTDSRGIGPGYALYTPLSTKLAGESVCPGTTGYYCPTGQTCKTRTGSAPYCCNDSTDCYNSLGQCADTSWQQYRVTIGASTSNFCCGNGTISVYQSTGQNSVGICATDRPAFYTAVSAISSGSCSYSTSSTVLSITLSSSTSTKLSSSSSQTSSLARDTPITTTRSTSTSTAISTSPRSSSTLIPDPPITFTRSRSTSTSVSVLVSPSSSSTFQSLTSSISSVSSSTSISNPTSTTQIIQSPTSSLPMVTSSTSSSVISTSTFVSVGPLSSSFTSPATSTSSSVANQSPPTVSKSDTSTSSTSSKSLLEISQSQPQSQSQSQSSYIDSTTSSSQYSSSVNSLIPSTFIGPVTIQSSILNEAESTSAPAESPAEPCDASLCLFSRVIPTSREL